MTTNLPRLLRRTIPSALLLATLAACNAPVPPKEPGQGDAMPAMQSGPETVGPAGLGPAGPASAIGSGNLANPGVASPGLGPVGR